MPTQSDTPRGELAGFIRRLLVTLALGALALVLFHLRHVLLLAFGAALVAVFLRALANPIRKRTPLNAEASLGAAVLAVIVLVVGAGYFVGAQVSAQLGQLQQDLPAAWAAAQRQIGGYQIGQWLLARIHESTGAPTGGFGPLAGRIGHLTAASFDAVAQGVVVVVAGVYFAAQPELYRQGLLKLVPSSVRPQMETAVGESAVALRKWLLGTALAMLAMGLLAGIGTELLGLQAPVALGLISGLAEFVPIVGAAVSAIPGLLLAATHGPAKIGETLIFYVAIHQVEGQLLIPLIQRRVVAVPPALTLFAVLGFGVLFGPIGVIFATPLALVVLELVKILYLHEAPATGNDAKEEAKPRAGRRGRGPSAARRSP